MDLEHMFHFLKGREILTGMYTQNGKYGKINSVSCMRPAVDSRAIKAVRNQEA